MSRANSDVHVRKFSEVVPLSAMILDVEVHRRRVLQSLKPEELQKAHMFCANYIKKTLTNEALVEAGAIHENG